MPGASPIPTHGAAVLVAALLAARAGAQDAPQLPTQNQDPHAARGFGTDSSRVDSQVTLRIPDGQADAVYEYLKAKYVGQDHVLAERFPDIHLQGQQMSDVSLFTDEYYDTPSLDLDKNKNSVRHRSRNNTTNPADRKSGRELVQVKVTPPGEFTLRTELKYEVEDPSKGKKTKDDSHPLIRLIADDQRDDFKKVFSDAGIEPYSLQHVFTIHQTRKRGYLNWDDKNIFSFSVDTGSARILWAEGTFSSVDLGLVEIAYTEADAARREMMWQIRVAIIEDLKAHFPSLVQTTDSKYSIVLAQLRERLPSISTLVRFGLIEPEAPLVLAIGLVLTSFVGFQLLRRSRGRRGRAPRLAPGT